jgi:hypothetical protein
MPLGAPPMDLTAGIVLTHQRISFNAVPRVSHPNVPLPPRFRYPGVLPQSKTYDRGSLKHSPRFAKPVAFPCRRAECAEPFCSHPDRSPRDHHVLTGERRRVGTRKASCCPAPKLHGEGVLCRL